MADTPDLGSGASAWGFKSPLPHLIVSLTLGLLSCNPSSHTYLRSLAALHDDSLPQSGHSAPNEFIPNRGSILPQLKVRGDGETKVFDLSVFDELQIKHPANAIRISPDFQSVALQFDLGEQAHFGLLTKTHNQLIPFPNLLDLVWQDPSTLILLVATSQENKLLSFNVTTKSIRILYKSPAMHFIHLHRGENGMVYFSTHQPFKTVWYEIKDLSPQKLSWASGQKEIVPFEDGFIALDFTGGLRFHSNGNTKRIPAPTNFFADSIVSGQKLFSVVGRKDCKPTGLLCTKEQCRPFSAPGMGALRIVSIENDSLNLEYSSLSEGKIEFHIPHEGKIESRVIKRPPLQTSEKLFRVKSRDGTPIPVTVVSAHNGANSPILLRVYGGYGVSQGPEFDTHLFPFLDNGTRIAYAHVRGGGECGPLWHKAGSGDKKKQTALDLEDVIDEFSKSEAPLFLHARSAGALPALHAGRTRSSEIAGIILEAPLMNLNGIKEHHATWDDEEFGLWGSKEANRNRAFFKFSHTQSLPPLFVWASAKDSIIPLPLVKLWLSQLNASKIYYFEDRDAPHEGPQLSDKVAELKSREFEFVMRHLK